ncbi:MAG TPA: DapH/DapD/GlmU-related protein [Solirubrobacteraceae bacterium]|nr:DapH/DapD/GlmU-related protein [Solirubrobacteraceae bacterium]
MRPLEPALQPDPRGPGLLLGEDVEIDAEVCFGPHVVLYTGARIGAGCSFGANVVVHARTRIAAGCSFGANVVVHAGTRIGAGCVVEDQAVLGKRPKLARGSSAQGDVGDLEIGGRVTVCAGAVVLAGARIGDEAILGDQSFVRERSRVGWGSVIGRGSVVDNDVRVGERVKVQTGVYLTAFTVVEDDVFVGPGASTTNDDTMARHDERTPLRGATLRRACRIGGSAVLTPGVEIGEEAFVAAGAVVTRDVPPRGVVMGVPARAVREVPAADLLERWR